ncbi:MAG: hypothetical protein ACPGVN_00965 [Alphaproteobacteria bacterium]
MTKKREIVASLTERLPAFELLHPMLEEYWGQISPRLDVDGFVVRLENYNVLFTAGTGEGNQRLYTSFHFMHPKRDALTRPVYWAAPFFRKKGLCGINVYPKVNCWYQHSPIRKFFRTVRDTGWFDQFDRRVTYGESMGATGALWHADVLKADSILAFSPQVCLDQEVVDAGDRRFKAALELDWDRSILQDRLQSLPHTTDLISFFDPRVDLDRLQGDVLKKLTSDNARMVYLPYIGHSTITLLARMGSLSELVIESGKDRISDEMLTDIKRSRKSYGRWLAHLNHYNERRPSHHQKWIRNTLSQHAEHTSIVKDSTMHPSHEKHYGSQARSPHSIF